MKPRISNIVGLIGKTLIVAGLLLLGLVAYQLWGTGIETHRAQSKLRDQFEELISAPPTTISSSPTSQSSDSVPTSPPQVSSPKHPIALIEIPTVNLSHIVVEGVFPADLRDGPGHMPNTPLPGSIGNSAIAGHRTTYGAPFSRLDELELGDLIQITTKAGYFEYEVTRSRVVAPTQVDVVRNTPGVATLTLITCHPRFSSTKRLIVSARLSKSTLRQTDGNTGVPTTSPTQVKPADTTTAISEAAAGGVVTNDNSITESAVIGPSDVALNDLGKWFSDRSAITPAILLGLLLAVMSIGVNFTQRQLRKRDIAWWKARMGTYAIIALPFLFTLFYWYRFINLLMPAAT